MPRNHASRWPREVPKLAPGRPGEKVEKREVLFDPFRIQDFFFGVDSHHEDKVSSKGITIQCCSHSLVIQVEHAKALLGQ